MPGSMQRRLLLLVLAAVAGAWIVTAVATWLDTRHELDELLDGHLAQAAALLIARQGGDGDADDHGVDSPELHRYAPRVAFQIFHEGRLTLRSANAPSAPMVDRSDGFATVRRGDETWRVFAARGTEHDVQVYVAEAVDSRTSILWAVMRSVMWPAVIALPLLAVAVWGSIRLSVQPLHRLGAALAERKPDALYPISLGNIPSEMLPMVEALNNLFDRIAKLLDSERRFTADAAHELRTPVAAVRAHAQVALVETNDRLRRHALQRTLDGCDRAARLVDQLLTLSRLDADVVPPMSAVDLAEVARQVVGELAPAALAKEQTIEVRNDTPCIVHGSETLLAALVRNLVDNATRHSPHAARIAVTVRPESKNKFLLTVEDSGAGLSDADLAKLGERFFRVIGTGEIGSGLGWSIVRRIIEVHRFDVQARRSAELGGLAVCVIGDLMGR